MKLVIGVIALILSGCGIQQWQGPRKIDLPDIVAPIAPAPEAECNSPASCEIAWAAARNWLLANSVTKLQIYSSDYMENYNPYRRYALAMNVRKDPIGNGIYKIKPDFKCAYPDMCNPSPQFSINDFNKSVALAVQHLKSNVSP